MHADFFPLLSDNSFFFLSHRSARTVRGVYVHSYRLIMYDGVAFFSSSFIQRSVAVCYKANTVHNEILTLFRLQLLTDWINLRQSKWDVSSHNTIFESSIFIFQFVFFLFFLYSSAVRTKSLTHKFFIQWQLNNSNDFSKFRIICI